MPQAQSTRVRKPLAGWVIGIAALLLLVDVAQFTANFHLGLMRALDLYPLDTAEMVGYDVGRVGMWAFIV